MHNWPIAVLEHFGLLTRTEAEHIANEIKTTIGSENYTETYDIVKNIIVKGEFKSRTLLPDLEAKVKELETKIKVLETTKVPKTQKTIAQPLKTM